MLRFGPDTGPVVVVALPLFEEANRTRAFAVTILRALAERGIAGALPDLPGQGESLLPTHETDLAKLRTGFAAAVASLTGPTFTATSTAKASSPVRSRDSQPAMQALSTSGSFSASHVRSRGAGISRSPVSSMVSIPFRPSPLRR